MVSCAGGPTGELIVDADPRPFRTGLTMVPAAPSDLPAIDGRDRLSGTPTQTMEHRMILPGEETGTPSQR